MSEVTRQSVLALIEELTRGTPVSPSAATDYTALQEDVTMQPSFDELENAELASSIGQKQNVLGVERPTMSLSHYMRHSGVEGQAPDYNLLLKALLGNETINSTEYDTIAGSTAGTAAARAVVKVDSGEGATFARGQALLIKDATNGYNVRNIYSISTDDLSLGFNLANAPASGVNLGKCVAYKPAANDTDFPTLSAFMYRGNGGALELMSGCRTSAATINIPANDYINASFTVDGTSYRYNPIEITASNKYIDFNDGGLQAAVITEGFYKDPNELADEIALKMDAQSSDTITCTYSSSTGKFTIATDGVTLSLLWNTGTNTANGAHSTLGFSSAADDTGATSYTSDTAQSWVSPYTPTYDNENPVVAKNIQVQWGTFDEYACKEASNVSITVTNDIADVNSICAESGRSDTVFSSRTVEITTTFKLERHEVNNFTRFREGSTIAFATNYGRKSSTNWVAGSVGNIYVPTATITSFELADENGLVVINLTIRAFVESGQTEEIYFNFL